jgi:hypothetical protein
MQDPDLLARKLYRAYGQATGFKNVRDEPMPSWELLGPTVQQAWRAAAEAVALSAAEAVST